MNIVTVSYNGSNDEMMRIVNEQADKGMRLVTIQDVEAGNFLSFAPKEYATTDEKLLKAQERIAELEKADLDNKELINGLAEIILGGM